MGPNKVCVFSGSTKDLNTSMSIKLDNDQVVEVWISDAYADDATPRAVREAYVKNKTAAADEIRVVQEMAARLGLQLVPAGQAPAAPNVSSVVVPNNNSRSIMEGARVVSGREADKPMDVMVTYAQDGASSMAPLPTPQYKIASGDKPTTDLREGERAEIGLVKGRNGMDIAVPVRREGKMGVTHVAVIDTGGDNQLQRRFKSMARASETEGVCYGQDGYDVKFVRCAACGGGGRSLDKKNVCPKCKGAGEMQISRF